jgi:hypothetical protein
MMLYKKIINIFITLILLTSNINALNLTLTDFHNPAANHLLDAEVVNDILIISGMLQGIEFYNIANPNQLDHLTNFTLSSGGGGGGGGGGGTKSNCVRAIDNYAYFTSSNGLYIVDISNPSNPQSLGSVSGTNNLNLENLDVYENILAVCAHEDGLLLYDISNPSSPQLSFTINTENAWAAAIRNNIIYIADQNFISIYNITNLSNPSFIRSIETSNLIKDIVVSDNLLYVAIGTDGVNVYSISEDNFNNPLYLDNYNTGTMANRISILDNYTLAVSDWEDIDVLEWDGFSFNQVGYKNTGNRTMAIATKENFIYSAEWASVQAFEYGDIQGPDIDLNTWELNYPYVGNGDSYSLSLDVINNGNELLSIIDNYTTNSEFLILNPLTTLQPGQMQTVEIIYSASNLNASGSYRIFSNDEDESEIICETNGNIDGANIGEAASDFELEYVANGFGSFKLSDHLGKVVVIAFFAPN